MHLSKDFCKLHGIESSASITSTSYFVASYNSSPTFSTLVHCLLTTLVSVSFNMPSILVEDFFICFSTCLEHFPSDILLIRSLILFGAFTKCYLSERASLTILLKQHPQNHSQLLYPVFLFLYLAHCLILCYVLMHLYVYYLSHKQNIRFKRMGILSVLFMAKFFQKRIYELLGVQ